MDFGKGTLGRPSKTVKIRVRDMREFLYGDGALGQGDRLVYQYSECSQPAASGQLNFGVTRIRPGLLGKDFDFTRGHYHSNPNAAEVYFVLRGRGILLTQTRGGETAEIELEPGRAVYIPPGWGHRAVNSGRTELIYAYVYPSDAGHSYQESKEKAFRRRVVSNRGAAKLS